MIEIAPERIPEIMQRLIDWLGEPTTVIHGRDLNGFKTKAKYIGPGWMIWTDHGRSANHGLVVFGRVSFTDPATETMYRLKWSEG